MLTDQDIHDMILHAFAGANLIEDIDANYITSAIIEVRDELRREFKEELDRRLGATPATAIDGYPPDAGRTRRESPDIVS